MIQKLQALLGYWPKPYIDEASLATELPGSDSARYNLILRAIKKGWLTRVVRGVYLIDGPFRHEKVDLFELAIQICSPSYISLESALSYHGWIPEATYTVTCVTPKRGREFATPVGVISYAHTPAGGFHAGVTRQEDLMALIAEPWKAVADLMYTRRLCWASLESFLGDLRIEEEFVKESDLDLLEDLAKTYASPRVRRGLSNLRERIVR